MEAVELLRATGLLARARRSTIDFLKSSRGSGCEIVRLPQGNGLTLDSIYTRDAAVVSADGVILASMGKAVARGRASGAGAGAPTPQECRLPDRLPLRAVSKAATSSGSIRGRWPWGWAPGPTHEGIRQLQALLDDSFDELIVVPLPDYPGQHDVMHLMSLISPVDSDLAVVYSRLLPDAFRQTLLHRGYRFVDVPDDEFETMGTNVLALRPRECVMLSGNPKTRAALEKAGAQVHVYDGQEISLKGGGGPTCLTRPLARLA